MPPTMDDPAPLPSPPTRRFRWWPVVIVAVVAVVFGRSVGFDFVTLDDEAHLVADRHMHPFNAASARFFWTSAFEGLYIPATYTAWGLLTHVGQVGPTLDPAVFHLANVALHAANAVFVWLILRRVTGRPGPAAVGALVFAVHPLQVEAVAWVSGFKDTFAAFWSLLAVLLFLRQTRAAVGVATAAFVVALSAKPAAAVVPAVAGLLLWATGRPLTRQTLAVLAGWGAIAVPYLLVTRHLQSDAAVMTWNPPAVRPLVAADALATYGRLLVWPARLAVDYGRTPRWTADHVALVVTGIAAAAVATAALLWAGRRDRWVAAGVAVAAAAVSPVLGLVPFTFQQFSTVADRYAYLSMVGVGLVVAWAMSTAGPRARPVAAAVLLALGVRSTVQAGVWANSTTLFAHALAVNPRSGLSAWSLGTAAGRAGDWPAAERLDQLAVDLDPAEPKYLMALSAALVREHRPAEARAAYARSLVAAARRVQLLDPASPLAHRSLARAYDLLGRPADATAERAAATKPAATRPLVPPAGGR